MALACHLLLFNPMSERPTLLVPIDFSSHSRAALQRAAAIALACGADLRLIHALHLPPVAIDFVYSEAIWSDLRRAVEIQLQSIVRGLEDRGLHVSACIEEQDAADAIRVASRAADVEMIVMGSHGCRGLDRLLLGSVAERTLHGAAVPVLIVREDEGEAAKPIRSILFATDFSNDSERAETSVTRLARVLGCEVEVFHAIQETAVLFAPYAVKGYPRAELELREGATLRMEGCLKRFQDAGVTARSKIVYGFASEEILKRAEFIDVQLIAMGTRGYAGLRRYRLGSVSQRVLRDAPCNVLIAGDRPSQPRA